MIKIDNYKVYAHINKANGKIYIGITKQEVDKRWKNGNGYKKTTYFYSAIQKYGWDGFDHEVIASGLSKEEAENFEILLIDKLKTNMRDFGYNFHKGGNILSDEALEKITGGENGNARKVICITTGKVFDTIGKAGEYYNTSRKNISHCCNKEQYTAGHLNNKPLVWMYYNEYLKNGYTKPVRKESKRKTKIICLNDYKVYKSITDASKKINVNGNQIGLCCQLINTCIISNNNKLYFMYYDDYVKYGEFDLKNKINNKNIKIFCLTNNKIYKNIKEVIEENNLDYNSAIKSCRAFHFKNELFPVLNRLNQEILLMYYNDALERGYTKISDYTNNIICLNNKNIYYSLSHASYELKIDSGKIKGCCYLNRLYTTKDEIKYFFMCYDDYLKFGEFDFENDLNGQVICLTTNKIFKNTSVASEYTKLSNPTIRTSCRNYHFKKEILLVKNNSTGEETTWMYYEDYLKYKELN